MSRINTGSATGTDEASSGYEINLGDDSGGGDSGGSDGDTVDEVTYSGGINSSSDEDSLDLGGDFVEATEKAREQSDLQESTIMVRVDAFAVDAGNIQGTIHVHSQNGSRSYSARKSSRYRRFQYYIEEPIYGDIVVSTDQGQDKKQSFRLEPGDVERFSFDIQKDPSRTPNDPNDYIPQEDVDADEYVGDTATDDAGQPSDTEGDYTDTSTLGYPLIDANEQAADEFRGTSGPGGQYGENEVLDDPGGNNSSSNGDTATTMTTGGPGGIIGILMLLFAGLALGWRLLFG